MDPPTRAFLERQRVAHLATVDAEGTPQVIPICFVLATATDTRLDVLRAGEAPVARREALRSYAFHLSRAKEAIRTNQQDGDHDEIWRDLMNAGTEDQREMTVIAADDDLSQPNQ